MFNAIKNKFLLFNIFAILVSFNLLFADSTDGCELPVDTISLTSDGDVLYNVPSDFAGVQFNVVGATVNGVSGGEAGAVGWILQGAGDTVLGFSFSNTEVTTDCGLLFTLTLDGEATGLTNIVFTDVAANTWDHIVYYEGGDDAGDCASGVYDCDGVCDGTAVEDCTGTCGGTAENLGCGCGEAGPSGCDSACGSTAADDDCGVCGGDNSTCSGCTDVFGLNYDSQATIDSGCEYADHQVEAGMFYYDPSSLQIELGESVQWNNVDGFHDVVVTSGPETFSFKEIFIDSIAPSPPGAGDVR